MQSISKYILAHWNGELPLKQSFWINWLAGHLASIVLALILFLGMRALGVFEPTAIIIAVLLDIPVYIWQIVGVWRAANLYAKNENINFFGWSSFAKILLVVSCLGFSKDIALLGMGFVFVCLKMVA